MQLTRVCIRPGNSSLSREPRESHTRVKTQFPGSCGIVLSTRLYYFVKMKPTEYRVHRGKKRTWYNHCTGSINELRNRDFVTVNKHVKMRNFCFTNETVFVKTTIKNFSITKARRITSWSFHERKKFL